MILLYLAALILAGILASILKACKVRYYWLISGIFFIGTIKKSPPPIAARPTLDPRHLSGENPPHGHHPNPG